MWNVQPYTGNQEGQPEVQNVRTKVVLEISLLLKGHNIICNNLLYMIVVESEAHSLWNIARKQIYTANTSLDKGHGKLYSSFAFQNDPTLVSYVPRMNKSVFLQITLYNNTRGCESEKKLTEIITTNNFTQGAVDTL